jgi:predicted MFS family arabinose efflux permease
MVALGLLGTAMTQGLIACAAALAAPGERGRVVGAAQGGVVIGLLAARSLAGVVTDLAGWRAVYLVSGAAALAMLAALARLLPAIDAPRERSAMRRCSARWSRCCAPSACCACAARSRC